MSKLSVNIVNRSHHPHPAYATDLSAGMDLRAFIPQPITLGPQEIHIIPTGIHIALPQGYEAQIRPRSGLACKHGISVPNSPGTIDADYRGEIKVALINLSNRDYTINDGDRIAQMVVARHESVVWHNCDTLDNTERGEGGFGHTGQK